MLRVEQIYQKLINAPDYESELDFWLNELTEKERMLFKSVYDTTRIKDWINYVEGHCQ